jgi:hypothetical protein
MCVCRVFMGERVREQRIPKTLKTNYFKRKTKDKIGTVKATEKHYYLKKKKRKKL